MGGRFRSLVHAAGYFSGHLIAIHARLTFMNEAEAYSIAGRASIRKRWAKTKERAVEPRTDDTRTARVLAAKASTVVEHAAGELRIAIAQRVAERMARQEDIAPAGYYGQELRRSLITLQEYADEFDREGQREKAVQVHFVLVKYLKDLAAAEEPLCHRLEADEMARMEAEVAAMGDEELERLIKQPKPPTR